MPSGDNNGLQFGNRKMNNPMLSKDNILFRMARQGNLRLPRNTSPKLILLLDRIYPILAALFCLSLPVLTSIPVSVLAIGIWLTVSPEVPLDLILYGDNYRLALFLSISFFPVFIIQWIWLHIVEQRPLRSLGLQPDSWLRRYVRGLLLGFLMISISVGLPASLGLYTLPTDVAIKQNWLSLLGILAALIGWIIQGAAEEILLRGYLLPVTGVRYGPVSGILLSSLIFAALHLFNENLTPLAILNLVLFGIFASLYALTEGSLWGIFAIHSIWNWAQGSLYGFAVSGIKLGAVSPINLTENGPDWLTGGAFGPEGGLFVTLVLFAAIILLWGYNRHRDR